MAAAIEPADRTRVVRALELIAMGERPAAGGDGSRLWTARLRHPTVVVGLVRQRAELYARIDRQVEEMVAAGAPEEARRAAAAGVSRTARAALGFEELLAGNVEAMKRRTRNYAKRQLTWLRRLPDVHRVDLTGLDPAGAPPRSSASCAPRVRRRALREVAGARQRLRDRGG